MSKSSAPRRKSPTTIEVRDSEPPDSAPQQRIALKTQQLLGPEVSRWLNDLGLHAHVELRNASGRVIELAQEDELFQQAAAHHKRASSERDLSALGALTASLSHEIRNILSGVLGLSQLRARSGPDAKTFATIAVEAARGTRLLSNFLSVSHQSKSSAQLTTLPDILDPIRLLTEAETQRRLSTVRFIGADNCRAFVTDGSRAKQVLLNLVLNALQATSERGCLEVTGRIKGPWLELTVDDNGPGVPKDQREKIFEPFYSTRHNEGGTGLGLSKAMQLVKSVSGELRVVDSPLGGARFELRLPIRLPSTTTQKAHS